MNARSSRPPVQLTVGFVARHFNNRAGGWDPAMLDIAQDHVLCHLAEVGLFDLGLVFKGGTALRKCRAGTKGRFSTDLDFAAPTDGLAEMVLDALDGHACHGFTFDLRNKDAAAGRADLDVTAPLTQGNPNSTRADRDRLEGRAVAARTVAGRRDASTA